MRLKESINQNQINLLKATYGDIKKINPNSPAVKKLMMALKNLSKDDLETLSKAKINFVSTMAQSILRDSNVSESASKEAMGIAAFTATRGDAVQKFIDDNGIDASALYKYVKNGKMPERMAFVSALVGNPGNKMFKMIVSKFGMSESVNEAVSFKDGKYHFYSKNEMAYLTYGGKEISSGDWDVDADAYFMNHSSWKGQKAFDDGKAVIRYFKKNNIITESSKDDILKDLDKAKTDLLKKVEVLIAKKKKLYSNVDITTPMSADEKKLDKDIADLFSQINTLVLQKRDINRKSVNEAKKSKDVKGIRAVEAVSNNVDAIIDLVLYENRDPKEVIDTMVPVLLNAIKETIKHKYKPSSADPSNAKKLNEFLSEIKKFQKLVEDLLNRPSKAGVKKIEDAWKNIWNHKHGANIILNGKRYDSIIESAKKSTFTKVARISNNGKLDIY